MSRMQNTVVICPIIYGSMAFYLGKKAEEFCTHRWTLYLRGPQDEDLSTFVEKVAFTLHPSFPNPIRETGWGEFEAGIRIFFKDPEEQPVDLFHQIRLYPPVTQQQMSAKKPVVAENYDEIVFADPHATFHAQLMQYNGSTLASLQPSGPRKPTAFPEHYANFDESLDLEILSSIQQHLQEELAKAKQKLINVDSEVIETHNERKALEAAAAAAHAENATPVLTMETI
eukprot:scaffold3341_cov165-Ochromonas_danica.AAC.20